MPGPGRAAVTTKAPARAKATPCAMKAPFIQAASGE